MILERRRSPPSRSDCHFPLKVMRLVHAKKLQLGTSERLKETELQRRKRHGRGVDGGAGSTGGGDHVASYSHAMPDTPSRWLEAPHNLTVSDSEVAEWRRAAAYKGLQKTDQVDSGQCLPPPLGLPYTMQSVLHSGIYTFEFEQEKRRSGGVVVGRGAKEPL
jgi:hypothetical protein